MRSAILTIAVMLGASVLLSANPQVKDDLKGAGKDTKDAVVTGAKKTGTGTKKAYKSSTHAVKKGTHKAAAATSKGADKVADKTTTSPK